MAGTIVGAGRATASVGVRGGVIPRGVVHGGGVAGDARGPALATGEASVAHFVAFGRSVHDQRALEVVDVEAREELASGWRVVRLSRRQAEAEDLPDARGSHVNLGVEAPPAPADGVVAPV